VKSEHNMNHIYVLIHRCIVSALVTTTNYLAIFVNFMNFVNCIGNIVGVDKTYPHAKCEVNILIQNRVMAKNRFQTYIAVSQPS